LQLATSFFLASPKLRINLFILAILYSVLNLKGILEKNRKIFQKKIGFKYNVTFKT